jgi:hypothetical protein
MIGLAGLISGATLLLLLMAVILKGWLGSHQLESTFDGDADCSDSCPQEFVSRVFSRSDWEFVLLSHSASLEELFRRERKSVALVWVRQTAASIRNVMHEHAGAARRSQNIKITTEAQILVDFVSLLAVCGILAVTIQMFGPLSLGWLAQVAQRLSERLTELQETFETGALAQAGSHRKL